MRGPGELPSLLLREKEEGEGVRGKQGNIGVNSAHIQDFKREGSNIYHVPLPGTAP